MGVGFSIQARRDRGCSSMVSGVAAARGADEAWEMSAMLVDGMVLLDSKSAGGSWILMRL